jgi:outer membrane lipoprotein-sorting protein
MAELTIWLDQYDYVPRGFQITRAADCVVVRVEFSDESLAGTFEREFAR